MLPSASVPLTKSSFIQFGKNSSHPSYQKFLRQRINLISSTPNVGIQPEKYISEAIEISLIMNEDLRELRKRVYEKIKVTETRTLTEDSQQSETKRSSTKITQKSKESWKNSESKLVNFKFMENFNKRDGKIKELEDYLRNEMEQCGNLCTALDKTKGNDPSEFSSRLTKKEIELMKQRTECLIEVNSQASKLQNFIKIPLLSIEEQYDELFEKLQNSEKEIGELIGNYDNYIETGTDEIENSKNERKLQQKYSTDLREMHKKYDKRLHSIGNYLINFRDETENVKGNLLKNIKVLEKMILDERMEYEKILKRYDDREKNSTIAQLQHFKETFSENYEELKLSFTGIRDEIYAARELKSKLSKMRLADKKSALRRKEEMEEILDKLHQCCNYTEVSSKNFEKERREGKEQMDSQLKELESEYSEFVKKSEDRLKKYGENYEELLKMKMREISAWYQKIE